MMKLEQALKEYFGYSTFREGQKEIITALLKKQDVLAMLPTGTGKSICYQLPALLSDGVTLVVSPLLSLMEDQIQQLRSDGMKRVVALNSFLSKERRGFVLSQLHTYKMIYVSPEILQMDAVWRKLATLKIAFFVVDEAHCISQWGYDFRPDYLRLSKIRKKLGSPPCLAVTATAPPLVQEDICNMLEMTAPQKIIYSVDRPMISYYKLEFQTSAEKIERLKELVQSLEGPGLIYFSSRMAAEKCAHTLQEQRMKRVAHYHGGLVTEERLLIQQQFMNGELDVICCTSAFGMGINKKDIRYVIHFHYPTELEAYVQEVGRAARDGKESVAIVLYCEEDAALARTLVEGKRLGIAQWRELLIGIQSCADWEEAETMLIERFRFDDIALRTLHYQLEEWDVLAGKHIKPFLLEQLEQALMEAQEERRLKRLKKLQAMEQWLHVSLCRRKQLLAYFDETISNIDYSKCCDHCGAKLTLLKEQTPSSFVLEPWQETLAKLCQIEKELV